METRGSIPDRGAKQTVLKIATYPPGIKDAAELFQQPDGDTQWERMIAEAKPTMVWLIDTISKFYDTDTLDGLTRACDCLLEFLVTEHPVARAKYIQQIAAKLDVPESSVWEAFADMVDGLHKHYLKESSSSESGFKTLD